MSTQFDPYYSWLGIPPAEQPPNHYRLLGITLFEPNEDVIQNGLDQRMMHLRSFSGGPRGREAERLITEVSQAGVCLLRRDRRQAYDTQLKSFAAGRGRTSRRATAGNSAPCHGGSPGLTTSKPARSADLASQRDAPPAWTGETLYCGGETSSQRFSDRSHDSRDWDRAEYRMSGLDSAVAWGRVVRQDCPADCTGTRRGRERRDRGEPGHR